mmetsp:Transcript_5316/g.9567  ORF Transcript_5316/g.9567 Transcript_5316/m.9567 type:complete len:166 (-) Transcript_5316:74-571(-)
MAESGSRRRTRAKLSGSQQAELKEAFGLFDTEQIGSIDYHELKVAIRALGFNVTRDEARGLAEEYDVEAKGRVTLEDFLHIMTGLYANRDPAEQIRKAFQLFDQDNSGKITLRNLRRIARELGENLDEAELQAMIDEFDRNLDGSIDADEFTRIMSQNSTFSPVD